MPRVAITLPLIDLIFSSRPRTFVGRCQVPTKDNSRYSRPICFRPFKTDLNMIAPYVFGVVLTRCCGHRKCQNNRQFYCDQKLRKPGEALSFTTIGPSPSARTWLLTIHCLGAPSSPSEVRTTQRRRDIERRRLLEGLLLRGGQTLERVCSCCSQWMPVSGPRRPQFCVCVCLHCSQWKPDSGPSRPQFCHAYLDALGG